MRLVKKSMLELMEGRWMGLFKSELYRSFAVGFGAGAVVFMIMSASQVLAG